KKVYLICLFIFSAIVLISQNGFVRLDDFMVNGVTTHRRIWKDSSYYYTAGTMSEVNKYPGIYSAKYNYNGDLVDYLPMISKDTIRHILNNSSSEWNGLVYRLGT